MTLNLLSFNAWGLNEVAAVDSLKLYIQECRSTPDIVLIQEHKSKGDALTKLEARIW
jgi:exonuclease III